MTIKTSLIALVCLLFITRTQAQRPAPDVIETQKGNLSIQPVFHASLLLTYGKTVIYADPSGAENFKGLASPDIIVITDIHGDHYDSATLVQLMKSRTTLVVPPVVAAKLGDEQKKHLVVLKNGESATVAGIVIKAIPMYNLPESPNSMHTKGRGNGYVLTIGGKNIYISGDTQGIPEMRALTNIDVAFVCMNLPYTMTVNEAADAVLAFKPVVVYPYHYRGKNGMSDVNAFKTLVNAGNTSIDVRIRNWYPGAAL